MTPFVSRSVMGRGFCEPRTSALPRTNTAQALAHTKSHTILPCFFNEISAKICGLNLTPTCTAPSLSSFSVELILHNLRLLERNLEGCFFPQQVGGIHGGRALPAFGQAIQDLPALQQAGLGCVQQPHCGAPPFFAEDQELES